LICHLEGSLDSRLRGNDERGAAARNNREVARGALIW
jgi:hypothetical protein